MNQPAKSHEPSMEEILASIRRIIADDDAKTPQPAAFAEPPPPPSPVVSAAPPPMHMVAPSPVDFLSEIPPAAPPPPEPEPLEEAPDILDLTEDMRAPEPVSAAPSFTTIDAQADVVFADSLPPRVEPEPEPEPEMPAFAMQDETPAYDPLEAARQTLAEQVEMDRPLLSRSTTAAVDTAFASLTHTVLSQNARTLDDLVKDMLRPMLKSWLDDNLPGLVERLVRAEIERVSRGR
jgi:cell pole-organizing protein PopZ